MILPLIALLLPLSSAAPIASRRRLGTCWECTQHGTRSWLGSIFLSKCTCNPGWEGSCCELPLGHDSGDFELKRIRNDAVELELAYATSQSPLPEEVQGIFWMDQRGVNVEATQESDPGYAQVGSAAADELLLSFGEAAWDPQTRCVGRVPVFGGSEGHWTYMDQGEGKSDIFESTLSTRLNLEFCFRDRRRHFVDIHSYFKAGDILEAATGYNLPETVDGYFALPEWIMHLSMERRPWGWDRVTKVLDLSRMEALRAVLPRYLLSWATSIVSTEAHYPVFQIVDGEGRRTEHYAAYLEWANSPESWSAYNMTACSYNMTACSYNMTDCSSAGDGVTGFDPSTFFCPQNKGQGTQLVGIFKQR